MEFEHVLVVGAGQMGAGIAQVVAGSGRRVSLYDPFPGAVERASRRCERSLGKLGADVEPTRRSRGSRRATTSSRPT